VRAVPVKAARKARRSVEQREGAARTTVGVAPIVDSLLWRTRDTSGVPRPPQKTRPRLRPHTAPSPVRCAGPPARCQPAPHACPPDVCVAIASPPSSRPSLIRASRPPQTPRRAPGGEPPPPTNDGGPEVRAPADASPANHPSRSSQHTDSMAVLRPASCAPTAVAATPRAAAPSLAACSAVCKSPPTSNSDHTSRGAMEPQ